MTRLTVVLAVLLLGLVLLAAREIPQADFDFGTGLVRH